VQSLPLAIEHQALLLRVEVERAFLLPSLELAQTADLLLDRREVGQHTTEPALGDVERVRPLRLALDHRPKLPLGADEENPIATGHHITNERLSQLELTGGLLEVDDVDAIALREDELAHLR